MVPLIPAAAALSPAAIAGITAAGSAALGVGSQFGLNRMNIKQAKEIMQTQRDWALSDWEKVNAYNHPAQQMIRYKEAGLNPQLIYGSANNAPSAMVRSSASPMPNIGGSGYQAASSALLSGSSAAMNNYFAQKNLDNSTNLTNAQILKLKSETDRTNQQVDFTGKAFQSLLEKVQAEASKAGWDAMYSATRAQNQPSKEQFIERFLAETAQKDASAAHALALFKLAVQEGVLKDQDIETLNKLSLSRNASTGASLMLEVIKMALRKK